MFLAEVFPGFLTVVEEPLVAEGDHAFISGTRDNFVLGLVVGGGEAQVEEVLADDGLGVLDFHAYAEAGEHDALVKALKINLILGLSQLLLILL